MLGKSATIKWKAFEVSINRCIVQFGAIEGNRQETFNKYLFSNTISVLIITRTYFRELFWNLRHILRSMENTRDGVDQLYGAMFGLIIIVITS